jgi:hypothetical protein
MKMKASRYVLAALLAVVLCGCAASAAYVVPVPPQGRVTFPELANFDRFLMEHPIIDIELRRKPSLVDDPKYMEGHRELREFLHDHPALRNELKAHPNYFMEREEQFQRNQAGANPTFVALRSFDLFLDSHPEIDRELKRRPMLIDDNPYLVAHPDLREFLAKHPLLAQEIRRDPGYFMYRERVLERHRGY